MIKGKLLVPLTDCCHIAIGSLSDIDSCLVVEVTQRKMSDDIVTTLLLNSDKARELAEALLQRIASLKATENKSETQESDA